MTDPTKDPTSYDKLIKAIARRVKWSCGWYGVQWEDIVQEGYLGLMHAWRKYDDSRGVPFKYYATQWIQTYCQRYIENCRSTVRVPSYLQWAKQKLVKELERRQMEGESLELAEAAESVGITLQRAKNILGVDTRAALTLDMPMGESGIDTWLDMLPDNDTESALDRLEREQEEHLVRDVFATLDERFKMIAAGRLAGDDSLGKVAEVAGVTRERIRQQEPQVAAQIRKRLAAAGYSR